MSPGERGERAGKGWLDWEELSWIKRKAYWMGLKQNCTSASRSDSSEFSSHWRNEGGGGKRWWGGNSSGRALRGR